uniref:Amine oxidase domain-containing protein n=1 Tax=Eutreptiella gymnastica TaxID=73025 RepID=A0A7S1NIK9_9EUGL|mmetsp:Transcript_40692/g.72836  ORF Transcript_40692/g.72836 Transcript_40692/m.72836 type:complete len:124 (+) Transcript_40692:1-372(+)
MKDYWPGQGLLRAHPQPRPTVIRLFVEYLDLIFGEGRAQVASQAFHRGMVHSWDKHPGARGCYAYPAIDSTGCREELGRPVAGRLYFAGEAYNARSSGNVHSAMESGLAAAQYIVAASSMSRL